MIDYLVYLRGRWRIYFGSCPMCNSDAPEIDACEFCESFHGWRDKSARRALLSEWLAYTKRDFMRNWT